MLYVALAQLVVIVGLGGSLLGVVVMHSQREERHAGELGRAHERTTQELLELVNRLQHPTLYQPPPPPTTTTAATGPVVDVVEPEPDGFDLAGTVVEFEQDLARLVAEE